MSRYSVAIRIRVADRYFERSFQYGLIKIQFQDTLPSLISSYSVAASSYAGNGSIVYHPFETSPTNFTQNARRKTALERKSATNSKGQLDHCNTDNLTART